MRQTDLEDFTGEFGRALKQMRLRTRGGHRPPAAARYRYRYWEEVSVRELSAYTGIGRNRLHAVEAGKTEPSCREIALVVSALGGDVSDYRRITEHAWTAFSVSRSVTDA